mmetsp:Transcript_88143/g.184183  ORF Transcript_88143/g.184183 Transcript_88143/m.184183 type:complete len:116 (-) Transcript_88143:169-516(-)
MAPDNLLAGRRGSSKELDFYKAIRDGKLAKAIRGLPAGSFKHAGLTLAGTILVIVLVVLLGMVLFKSCRDIWRASKSPDSSGLVGHASDKKTVASEACTTCSSAEVHESRAYKRG